MNRTELREKLNKIDCENCNQYDLVNLFESVKLSNEDLNKLSEMVNNEKAVYNFLNEKAYPSAVFSKSDIVKSPKKLTESKEATKRKASINEGFNGLGKDAIERIKELESSGEVNLTIATGDDGEDFLIVDSYDDIQKLQKAIDPNFEPEDKYDTSLLYDTWSGNWGFQDEYAVCDMCGKAVRTSPDSYSWTADFFADYDNGEFVCGDCVRENPANYLNSLINNPKNANTILDKQGLEAEGFELIEDDYENGWYDRSDNPEEILKKALEENPNAEFVFSISTQEQFRTNFELWGRGLNKTLGEGANSMSSTVERQTLGYKKTKGQIQCNGGEQAKEVEDLLKAKYDNVTTQKGKGGKVIIKFSKNESLGEPISESSNGYFAYHDQIVDALIARCQREGVLSTDSETLHTQLADILGVEQEDIADESYIDINDMVSFCQRQGVLPTSSDELIDDLESLTDLEREDIEELLDESLSEEYKLCVGYKDKETNRTYSREYPYNGETNKKSINWLKDADKIAYDNCAPNEDVLGYSLVEVGEDESLSESVDPNTIPDDYVLLNPGIRNYTDEDIDFYYECIKELVYPEEIEYEDLEVTFITNQRDADDWDEETYKIDWTYRPKEDDALDVIAEYLGEKFPGKITVGDIKKSAEDIQKYLYDHYYEDAVEDAKSKNSLADFREQLKEDKAKDTMKSVVAKWRSRRSNKSESVEDDNSNEKKDSKNIAGIEHL